MLMEILNALAALATVAGFVLDVVGKVHDWLERRNARKRMEREEAPSGASGTK